MMAWVQDKARRLVLAGGVAFVVGAPTIACMGGEVEVTDAATDGATDGGGDEASDPKKLIVGNFRMMPPEDRLRELKIIGAAISKKPGAKEKLGKLSASEQKLFDEWARKKKGPELKGMIQEIKFAKGMQFKFTDDQVTVQFGDDSFGPVPYTIETATDTRTVVKFDPGIGNGMETHDITWKPGHEFGTDNITGTLSGSFVPLEVRRIGEGE